MTRARRRVPSGSQIDASLSCHGDFPVLTATGAIRLETHGPLGILWAGLGLCGFYIALIWINTLLGFVLTPLFLVPLTWLQDRVRGKARARG